MITTLYGFCLMLLFKESFSCFAFNDTYTKNNNVVTDGPDRVKKDSPQKYFLPRVNLTNCDVLIDGRNFYNQPIGNQIKNYNEIRRATTGQGDDYTTVCLLDY